MQSIHCVGVKMNTFSFLQLDCKIRRKNQVVFSIKTITYPQLLNSQHINSEKHLGSTIPGEDCGLGFIIHVCVQVRFVYLSNLEYLCTLCFTGHQTMSSMCRFWIVVMLNIAVRLVDSYSIEIDAGNQECYSVSATVGMPCSGSFEILADDPVPITIKVTGPLPHKKLLYETRYKGPGAVSIEETEGDFHFDADTDGDYTLCISNGSEEDNDGKARLVAFNFRTITTGEKDYQYSGLEVELDEMKTGLDFLIDHISYMNQREDVHRVSLLVMRGKLLFWSIVEVLILLSMGIYQIMYISKFFEVKRRM